MVGREIEAFAADRDGCGEEAYRNHRRDHSQNVARRRVLHRREYHPVRNADDQLEFDPASLGDAGALTEDKNRSVAARFERELDLS